MILYSRIDPWRVLNSAGLTARMDRPAAPVSIFHLGHRVSLPTTPFPSSGAPLFDLSLIYPMPDVRLNK